MTAAETAFVEEIRRVSDVTHWEAEARALVAAYVKGEPVTTRELVQCVDRLLATLERAEPENKALIAKAEGQS